jgi:hypothetical protein
MQAFDLVCWTSANKVQYSPLRGSPRYAHLGDTELARRVL